MIYAATDWTAVGIILAAVVSLLSSAFGYRQATKSDKSATTTRTIELGVQHLIDQYQEQNKDLREDVRECNNKCDNMRTELAQQRRHIEFLETRNSNLESEIIAMKRRLGELP